MVMVVVWVFLGFLWWGAILFSLVVAAQRAPEGRKKRTVAGVAAVEGALVAATSLVPILGVFVWFPIMCVVWLPVVIVCEAIGVDSRGLLR
jgi:hypothetical protein